MTAFRPSRRRLKGRLLVSLRSFDAEKSLPLRPQQETLLPSPAEMAIRTQIRPSNRGVFVQILLCMGLFLEKWFFFAPYTPQGELEQWCDHTDIVQDGRAEQVGITVDGERQIDDADGALG